MISNQGKKYLELKQKTNRDIRQLGPFVSDIYEGVSTAGQTVIDFSSRFSVSSSTGDRKNTTVIVDGKELTESVDYDFDFTNGIATSLTLTSSLTSGINYKVKREGVQQASFPNPSSVQATINSDIKPRLHGSIVKKSADYTVLDNDTSLTFLFDNTSTDRTLTLPTAADNTDKVITIKNISTDKGKVTIDGEGTETIDGYTTIDLDFKNAYIKVQSDGSNWYIINENLTSPQKQYSEANGDFTVTGTNWTTGHALAIPYQTIDGAWRLRGTVLGTISATTTSINLAVSGVTFKNISNFEQPGSALMNVSPGNAGYCYVNPGNGNLTIEAAGNFTIARATIDVLLESKPTFVE